MFSLQHPASVPVFHQARRKAMATSSELTHLVSCCRVVRASLSNMSAMDWSIGALKIKWPYASDLGTETGGLNWLKRLKSGVRTAKHGLICMFISGKHKNTFVYAGDCHTCICWSTSRFANCKARTKMISWEEILSNTGRYLWWPAVYGHGLDI